MLRLEAPYPSLASVIILPSPDMANNRGLNAQVTVVRMMDGSYRSTVKRASGKFSHRYQLKLSRVKMQELVEFVERYRGATVRAVWRDTVIGKMTLNPVEPAGLGREYYTMALEITE